jgi:hypothetical protein
VCRSALKVRVSVLCLPTNYCISFKTEETVDATVRAHVFSFSWRVSSRAIVLCVDEKVRFQNPVDYNCSYTLSGNVPSVFKSIATFDCEGQREMLSRAA